MEINLRYAQTGDTIQFKCGGFAIIHQICKYDSHCVIFVGGKEESLSYYFSGHNMDVGATIFDVVKIVAPDINWTKVPNRTRIIDSRNEKEYIFIGVSAFNDVEIVVAGAEDGELINQRSWVFRLKE